MAAAFAEQTTRLQQTIAHDLHDLVGNQIAVAGEIQGLTKMVPGGRQLRWKPDACPALVRALTDQAPAQRRVSLRVHQMPDRWQVQVVIPTQRQELNVT